MRYANARYQQTQDELAYRFYIADSIQAIGEGKYLKKRFADMMQERKARNFVKDNRSGLEIATDILKGAGLEVISDG